MRKDFNNIKPSLGDTLLSGDVEDLNEAYEKLSDEEKKTFTYQLIAGGVLQFTQASQNITFVHRPTMRDADQDEQYTHSCINKEWHDIMAEMYVDHLFKKTELNYAISTISAHSS